MTNILILDDDPQVLRTLGAYLQVSGARIVTCSEIEAAEALLAAGRFDLVVTDLNVSAHGGLEGMRLVRYTSTHFPETDVYVLSGYLDAEVRRVAMAMGARKILAKPHGLHELRSLVLERVAKGPSAALPLAAAPAGAQSVVHVEPLEDFLAAASLRSVLQPIVSLQETSGCFEVYGFEALVRKHCGSALADPPVLFGYAARKQLLFEVDMLCIRAGLHEAGQLNPVVTTFLNLQPRSMTWPGFADRLCETVRAAGRREVEIVLELTEQQTVLNTLAFHRTLDELRGRGFRIALDDFGQGNSNLQLFYELRPDYLKINGNLCIGLATDELKQLIVRSAAEMALRAGAKSVIEFVETAEDAAMARELGVELGQGYYFSRPLPADELRDQPEMPTPARMDSPCVDLSFLTG